MAFGGFCMSLQPSNDPASMMIVLGLLFFVPGFLITAAAIVSWLGAKLYGSSSNQTKLYVRRAFGLLVIGWIAWSLISSATRPTGPTNEELEQHFEEQAAERGRIIAATPPRAEIAKLAPIVIEGLPDAHEQFFETPFSVQTAPEKHRFAEFRSGPGTQFNLLVPLERGETVEILAVTDVQQEGFLWYRIRTEVGLKGYLVGEHLCAKENWIDGIQHNCEIR